MAMLLAVNDICNRIEADELSIVPRPNLEEIRKLGGASIDLRLGRWFLTIRQAKSPYIDIGEDETSLSQKRYFIPFDQKFFLHPGRFILGITLEWIKLSNN